MSAQYAHFKHNATSNCADHAHDIFVRLLHNPSMDSEWFKERKKKRKVTDAALADALGVERSVANKIVNGRVPFNAWRSQPVANLLDVDVLEVLYRIGVLEAPPPERPWSPAEETVASLLQGATPFLLEHHGGEAAVQAAAHEIADQLIGFAGNPDHEDVPEVLENAAAAIERKLHQRSLNTPPEDADIPDRKRRSS